MKKSNSIVYALLLLAVLTLSNCNTSVKGKWSASDKTKFDVELGKVDLTLLGAKKQEFLDCYYKKVEAAYSSFQAANSDEAGCEKLALSCTYETLSSGSAKGKWSEEEKQKIYQELDADENMAKLGAKKAEWINCYISKLEAKFSSLIEASQAVDECTKLAEGCNEEVK